MAKRAVPSSSTWPWVIGYAHEMEAKLAENRHKGDREGWRYQNLARLLGMLKAEVRELEEACYRKLTSRGRKAVRREAADVGNIAMMIADVAGGLEPDSGIHGS